MQIYKYSIINSVFQWKIINFYKRHIAWLITNYGYLCRLSFDVPSQVVKIFATDMAVTIDDY